MEREGEGRGKIKKLTENETARCKLWIVPVQMNLTIKI
jgi:hypothetical protein